MNSKEKIKIEYTEEGRYKSSWEIVVSLVVVLFMAAQIMAPNFSIVLFALGLIVSAIVVITLKLLARIIKRIWIIPSAITLIVAALGFIFKTFFINGAVVYFNGVISNWNERTQSIAYFYVTNDTNKTLCLYVFTLLVILLVSMWTEMCIQYKLSITLILVNFIIFTALSLTVKSLPIWAIIWMAVGIVFYVALIDSEPAILVKTKSYFLILTIAVVLVCAGILIGIKTIPEEKVTAAQEKCVKFVEEEVYGKSDLTDGDLTNIKNKNLSEEKRLEVLGTGNLNLFFKGFVGSTYTGKEWADLEAKAYADDNLKMHQWLIDVGSSPVLSLSQALALTKSFNPESFNINDHKYIITNRSASKKFIYIPYGLGNTTFKYFDHINKDLNAENSFTNQVMEIAVDTIDMDAYDYEKLTNNGALTNEQTIENNPNLFNAEQTYRNYTEEYYLHVPQEIIDYFDGSGIEKVSGAYNAIITVRNYLREQIEYSDTPKNTFTDISKDKDSDFVLNLLEQDKEGYSVHYATVGTLLFRYLGIPARYVEGYKKTGDTTDITAKDAHAWVEIYRYGFGWVPVDVTPGYYENNSEIVTGKKNVSDRQHLNTKGVQSNEEKFHGQKEEEETKFALTPMQTLIALIVLLIIIPILIFVIRRLVILKKRKEKMNSGTLLEQIRYTGGALKKNLKTVDVELTYALDCSDENYMDRNFMNVSSMSIGEVKDVLVKANFSKEGPNEVDVGLVRAYYQNVTGAIYDRSKWLRKLKLKYINVIC